MAINDIDFRTVFPLLTFKNNEDILCREYMKTRGFYVYKQVYDALVNWIPDTKEITYEQFSSFIRYDKSIRDKLYIYLAAAEEYLRSIIFDELEINHAPTDFSSESLEISELRERTHEEQWKDSNLYFYSYVRNFDFGLIKQIFVKFSLESKYGIYQEDLTAIRILRNKVMHHNMLLLSYFTERSKIEETIKGIELGIEALYRLLPTKQLKEGSVINGQVRGGLTLAINKSNYPNGDISKQPYNDMICLHKFVNGGFIP